MSDLVSRDNCDHIFRYRDNYCIRCERRISGAGASPRGRSVTASEREFEQTPLIDTSHAQDDYYDAAGITPAGPDPLTENALREVLS